MVAASQAPFPSTPTPRPGAMQRDVPGLTRAAVPILARAGVKALSVGVNGASAPPDVPLNAPFWWVDRPSGTRLLAFWHAGGYSGDPVDSPDQCVTVAGHDEALCIAWRGDNQAPPGVHQVGGGHARGGPGAGNVEGGSGVGGMPRAWGSRRTSAAARDPRQRQGLGRPWRAHSARGLSAGDGKGVTPRCLTSRAHACMHACMPLPVLQVKRILQRVREGWPGAVVQASTFDAFTHKLLKRADKGAIVLPEVSLPVPMQRWALEKGGATPACPGVPAFPSSARLLERECHCWAGLGFREPEC